ncbi:MAG: SGNH/GDSL hydrolase family protein [Clostridia bacterium]|nr:SGNH/GDSL hydrolase family protein [Clostridia bacterium]
MKKLLCLLTALIMLAAASCSTPAETAANTAPASGPETAAQSAAAPADEQKYQDSDLTLWAECSASEGESIDLAKEAVTLDKGLTVKGNTLFSGAELPVMYFTAQKAGRLTVSTTPGLAQNTDTITASKSFELKEGLNRIETEISVPYGCTLTFGAPGDTAVLAASGEDSLCRGVTSSGKVLSPAVKILCSGLTEKLLVGEGNETEEDPKLHLYAEVSETGSAVFASDVISGARVTKMRFNVSAAEAGDTLTLNLVRLGYNEDNKFRLMEKVPAGQITFDRDIEDEWYDWEGSISVPKGWKLSFLDEGDGTFLGYLKGATGKTRNDRFLGFFNIKNGAVSTSNANQFLAMRIYGVPEPEGPEDYLEMLSRIEPPAPLNADELARLKGLLEGKSFSLLGDSITTFAGISNNTAINSTIGGNASYYGGGDRLAQADTWWTRLANDTGMQVCVNNSWSGSRILDGDGNTWQSRCVNLHRDTEAAKASGYKLEPDVILVYMGTNDYNVRNPVGDIDESLAGGFDYTKDEPKDTAEAFYITMKKLLERYPDADVIVMASYFVNLGNDDGSRLSEFNAKLKRVAELLGVDTVDLQTESGYTTSNQCGYSHGDTLHPNEEGMKLIASCVEKALLRHFG